MGKQTLGTLGGGIIGAVIGAYAFGPTGAYYGFSIGSSLGSYLTAPDVHTEGPRLDELKVQDSRYGAAIPSVYGAARISGQVIWSAGIGETKHTEDAGKGGPDQTQTTYTYSASFAVMLCEGEIQAIRRIWADSKLIYDISDGASAETLYATNQIADGITIYPGSETQTASALMEAHEGAGNVPGYRGFAILEFEDMQLSDYGNRIPSITAEVLSSGSDVARDWVDWVTNSVNLTGNTSGGANYHAFIYDDSGVLHALQIDDRTKRDLVAITGDYISEIIAPEPIFPEHYVTVGVVTWYGVGVADGQPIYMDRTKQGNTQLSDAVMLTINPGQYNILSVIPDQTLYFVGCVFCADAHHVLTIFSDAAEGDKGGNGNVTWYMLDFENGLPVIIDNGTSTENVGKVILGYSSWSSFSPYVCMMESNLEYLWNSNGTMGGSPIDDRQNISCWHIDQDTKVLSRLFDINRTETTYLYFSFPTIWADNGMAWVAKNSHIGVASRTVLTNPGTVALSSIVSSLSTDAGLVAGDIDVTDLSDTVAGYVRSGQMSARAAIQPLMSGYFFDSAEFGGKINYIKRGAAVTNTIADTDLGASTDGQAEKFSLARSQPLEIPRQINLTYIDQGAGYLDGLQHAERINTDSVINAAVQLPIVFADGDEPAQIAEILLFDAWKQETASFSLSSDFIDLNPTDNVTVIYDEVAYTVRLTGIDYAATGVIECQGVVEDLDSYTSTATGGDSGIEVDTIGVKGPTQLELLDIPLLQDSDADDGTYVAAGGYLSGWTGCQVYKSIDNVSWQPVQTIITGAVMGLTSTTLADADTHTTDITSSVRVVLTRSTDTLSSVSEALFLNGSNAALIGDEVVLFQTATLISAGVYDLTNLSRGRRGTEWATGSHATGEAFVLLNSALRRVPIITESISATVYFKAVTFGNLIDNAIEQTFTYAANGYKCYAPAHLAASDNGDGTYTATWTRRARKNAGWIDGTGVALVEDTELYRVEVWRASSMLSTADVTSATATVTATTADIIKVAQVSATVGAGNQSEVTL